MELENKWPQMQFHNREKQMKHMSYEIEKYFYYAIAHGDVDFIEKVSSQEHVEENKELGTLSHDRLRNAGYHCAISISLAARACIDNGLPLEEAFSLSDFYIQQIENCKTVLELDELTYHMNLDYTKRMKKLLKKTDYSKTIKNCIDYIYRNLHNNLRVEDLAEYVHKNRSYLSKQFKKEVGITPQEYIMSQKISEAKNLLLYSQLPLNEIAHSLAFSSQSHFAYAFRKYTAVTPTEYRNLNFGELSETNSSD